MSHYAQLQGKQMILLKLVKCVIFFESWKLKITPVKLQKDLQWDSKCILNNVWNFGLTAFMPVI